MAATNLSRFRRIQQKLEENNISEPYYPNLNRGKSEQVGNLIINYFWLNNGLNKLFLLLERLLWGTSIQHTHL